MYINTGHYNASEVATDAAETSIAWPFLTHHRYCTILQFTATHLNTLQHTATHCNTPQHTATHCNSLQHTATHCNALQYSATWFSNNDCLAVFDAPFLMHRRYCNALQRTTTHYNTLQRTATHCNALQRNASHCIALHRTHHSAKWFSNIDCLAVFDASLTATRCNALPCTATHCKTLQHAATHCNTLQHAATLWQVILKCIECLAVFDASPVLRHTATHCNTRQQSGKCFSDMEYLPKYFWVFTCLSIYIISEYLHTLHVWVITYRY